LQAQHPVVTITAPYNYYPGAGAATNLNANAHSDNGPITEWAVYVDGNLYAHAHGSPTLRVWVLTPMGHHIIEVKAWDGTGAVGSSEVQHHSNSLKQRKQFSMHDVPVPYSF
jgi:hypothetical protein